MDLAPERRKRRARAHPTSIVTRAVIVAAATTLIMLNRVRSSAAAAIAGGRLFMLRGRSSAAPSAFIQTRSIIIRTSKHRVAIRPLYGAFGGISSQPFQAPPSSSSPSPSSNPPSPTSPSASPPAINDDLADFRKLGLTEDILEAVRAFGLKEPSIIQKLVVPQALKGDDIAFSAATGSGKTLAYLLPIMQQLKWQEQGGKVRQAARPRALILVPTRELVTQVLEVTKALSHVVKLSSCGLHGGEDFGVQRRKLSGNIDIVVSSPGRLLQHYEKAHVYFSQVTTVVIDEMDTMLKDGFGSDIKKLMTPLETKSKREKVQYLMATATLTPAVRRLMETEGFPKTRFLQSEDAHKSLPTMRHIMMDTKGGDKIQMLLDVMSQSRQKGERVMVFCNTVQSCRAVEHALKEVSMSAVCYHGDMQSAERANSLEKFKSDEVAFLVCTDIASRGLDIPSVEHIVMFDFPLNPIEYLHRSGRTARMGAKGKVTSLLTKRDKVLASAIQTAVAKGLPLDALSARKRDYEQGGKLSGLSSGRVDGSKPGGGGGNRHSKYSLRARSQGSSRSAPRRVGGDGGEGGSSGSSGGRGGGRGQGRGGYGRGGAAGRGGPSRGGGGPSRGGGGG